MQTNIQNKCKKLKDKIISGFLNELRESNYYQIDFKNSFTKCLGELNERKVEQVICYGLGSFSNGIDITSRYQLALLLLIYENLSDRQENSILSSIIEIYDPSFDEIDKNTLEMFTNPKFTLINENEYCARRIVSSNKNGCSLIYMPHLDKYLYNNLLGANWTHENLINLLVLGNSFHEMIDSETSPKSQRDLYYLDKLVCNFKPTREIIYSNNRRKKVIKKQHDIITKKEIIDNEMHIDGGENEKALIEIKIDDNLFKHSDIFNSLSFHLINNSWLVCNHNKIEQYSLPGWSCVTSQPLDDWNN